MSQKIVAVVQARMGSSRLPGKSLAKIGNLSLIELVMKRVTRSKLVDEIILATTVNNNDDILAEHVTELGYNVYRGSELDVLSRFINAVTSSEPTVIVRITGDCPLISPKLIDKAIQNFNNSNVDYLSLSIGEGKVLAYPRGFDVEVTSLEALTNAYKRAEKKYEREHVMPYIYTHLEDFSIKYVEPEKMFSRPSYRLCVDTEKDLKLIEAMYEFFKEDLLHLDYKEIIEFLDINPEVVRINQDVEQKHFTVVEDKLE